MKTTTLVSLSTLLSFSTFAAAFAGSNEKLNELQNTLLDTYMFELRRKELRQENRTRAMCTQPTEELSYRMVNYLTGIVDRADGLPTTETIWNPNPELSEWEMLQDDGFTLVENRRNGWDDEQWQKRKDTIAYYTLAAGGSVVSYWMLKDIVKFLAK